MLAFARRLFSQRVASACNGLVHSLPMPSTLCTQSSGVQGNSIRFYSVGVYAMKLTQFSQWNGRVKGALAQVSEDSELIKSLLEEGALLMRDMSSKSEKIKIGQQMSALRSRLDAPVPVLVVAAHSL